MNKKIIIGINDYGRFQLERKTIGSNKERNTYIVYSESLAFIIDPQHGSGRWLKKKLGNLRKYRRVFILVSHDHKNHYGYLKRLLAYLAGQVEIAIIIPESICLKKEITPFCCIRLKVGEFYALTTDAQLYKLQHEFLLCPYPITISCHTGHCSSLLNISIRNEKGSGVLFCSDNVSSCFIPLIADGGDLNAMREYLSWVEINGPAKLLPGHGRGVSKDWIKKLIKYFGGLPFSTPPNPTHKRAREFQRINAAFHAKNKLSASECGLELSENRK